MGAITQLEVARHLKALGFTCELLDNEQYYVKKGSVHVLTSDLNDPRLYEAMRQEYQVQQVRVHN